MWPWEEPPHSVASGILDDETYDWLAVLRGMAATGGDSAVVADEDTLLQAQDLARNDRGHRASATGARRSGRTAAAAAPGRDAPGARVGVLLTGVQR
jgi:threonine synthase